MSDAFGMIMVPTSITAASYAVKFVSLASRFSRPCSDSRFSMASPPKSPAEPTKGFPMRSLITVFVLALTATAAACSGGKDSPSNPSPITTPSPTPAPSTVTQTLTGTLSAGDAPCVSVSIQNGKPCRRHAFTVANSGALSATLTWPSSSVDLDLELWRGTTRVTATDGVSNTETLSSNLSSGSYELRVVYYSGATIQDYSLRVTRPN